MGTHKNRLCEAVLTCTHNLCQNIDCGYSLELPRRGGSNVYPQSVLSKNKKTIKNFLLNIFIFYNFENLCILHG